MTDQFLIQMSILGKWDTIESTEDLEEALLWASAYVENHSWPAEDSYRVAKVSWENGVKKFEVIV